MILHPVARPALQANMAIWTKACLLRREFTLPDNQA